jgi:hypothetical protein
MAEENLKNTISGRTARQLPLAYRRLFFEKPKRLPFDRIFLLDRQG